MDEFELIDRYFRPLGMGAPGVVLGIGDDAAILDPPRGEQLVVTTDTQVESVHFPAGANAGDVGHRSCATALSDIAAMGAVARWASLALTIPRGDTTWLEHFARGSADALRRSGAVLVGGDTTAGPLVITWHIIGLVPSGRALRRDGARVGDAVYVSGTLGAAAAALELLATESEDKSAFQQELLERYWYPRPRFDLVQKLRSIASSCIDISDGLVADLTHIARSSQCGAVVEFAKIPISNALLESTGPEDARRMAATGGDDYELCFTVPPECEAELQKIVVELEFSVTRVGRMVAGSDVRVLEDSGATIDLKSRGYRHFD